MAEILFDSNALFPAIRPSPSADRGQVSGMVWAGNVLERTSELSF